MKTRLGRGKDVAIGGVTGGAMGLYSQARFRIDKVDIEPLELVGTNPTPGETTVYRAVTENELDDIAANGFRVAPESGYSELRLFAPTADEATQFGVNNFRAYNDGPVTIMKATVPNEVMKQSTFFVTDGMDAIAIPGGQLYLIKGAPLPYCPIPNVVPK